MSLGVRLSQISNYWRSSASGWRSPKLYCEAWIPFTPGSDGPCAQLRSKAGYSQESFADAIRVHRTSMGTLERGEGNPTLETIARIARGLEVSLGEFFMTVEKEADSTDQPR